MTNMTAEERTALIEKIKTQLDIAPDQMLQDMAEKMGLSDSTMPVKMAGETPKPNDEGVIDTSMLTGSISGLKNFLIKKAQDKQSY